MGKKLKPILITGSPRSGTTWIGKILSESPSVRYIAEPFNPLISFDYYQLKIPDWFLIINQSNDFLYKAEIERVFRISGKLSSLFKNLLSSKDLNGKIGEIMYYLRFISGFQRPLIKDPLAIGSAPWLAENFDLNIVVIIRHPAAFVSSAKRVNWGFDISSFAKDPDIYQLLKPYHSKLSIYKSDEGYNLENAVLFWNIIHWLILNYQKRFPEWIYLKYEDIAGAPLEKFKNLFQYLQIPFSKSIQHKIKEYTEVDLFNVNSSEQIHILKRNSKDNLNAWKRNLTKQEIEYIYNETLPVSCSFYSLADW